MPSFSLTYFLATAPAATLANVSRADARPLPQGDPEEQNGDAHEDRPRADRERRVPGETLVEDIPGGEPEPRLEDRDDAGREEDQPEEQAGATWGEPATDARVCAAH